MLLINVAEFRSSSHRDCPVLSAETSSLAVVYSQQTQNQFGSTVRAALSQGAVERIANCAPIYRSNSVNQKLISLYLEIDRCFCLS